MKSSILPSGIRLHRSGKFIVDKSINGTRITKTFSTLQDAVIFRTKLEDKAYANAYLLSEKGVEAETFTLSKAIAYCQQNVWRDLQSLKAHESNARSILAFFGKDTVLNAVTPQKIDEFKNYCLSKGNTTGTINRKLMVLSNVLSVAKDRGMLSTEPPKIKAKPQREGRIRVLSKDEEKMLQTLLTPECWEIVNVLLYTGCRASELWHLEARDIDLELGTVTFWETKTGRSRTIPIMPNIKPILSNAINNCPNGCIFGAWNNTRMERAWSKAKAQMGLQDDEQFVPYCLRHTCASRLAAQGVSLNLIKDWLGHASINTTMRYTHFRKSDLAQVAELFAKSL